MRRGSQPDDVTVLRIGEQIAVSLARERLESAGISYAVVGDTSQDLYGWGRIGTGFNFITGPVQFRVHRDDEAAAREIIGDLAGIRPRRLPVLLRLVAAIILLLPIIAMILQRLR